MTDLKIRDVRPFVPAKDGALSRAFYTALGWSIEWADDNLALMQVADQRFYLQNYYTKAFAEQFVLHLTVDDAQACYAHVSALVESGQFPGVQVQSPRYEPYGALVTYAHDPSGVLIHFAQWTNG